MGYSEIMAHIHTGPGEYDWTMSAFIARTDLPEHSIALHKHKILDVLLQFGGHVELTKDPWETLESEIRDESGYDIDQLLVLQPKDRIQEIVGATQHPIPVSFISHSFPGVTPEHNHIDLAIAFIADGPPNHLPRDVSPSDIRLRSSKELDEISPLEIYPNVRQIAKFVLDTCVTEWDRVSPKLFGK